MNVLLPLIAVLSLGTTPASSSPLTANASLRFQPTVQLAQSSRAESTCTSEVRDRGLRVVDILETNDHSGGTEVIMRVNRSGDDYTVGCDYNDSSRNVDLYRIEDNRRDSDDRFEDESSNDRFYRGDRNGSDRVSDRQDAEDIAREAVGDQLGIDDPDSDIVEINGVERNNQNWVVEGEANGAPFRVRIRSNDGSIDDFQLY